MKSCATTSECISSVKVTDSPPSMVPEALPKDEGAGDGAGDEDPAPPSFDWIMHQQRHTVIDAKLKRRRKAEQRASPQGDGSSASAHVDEPPSKRAKPADEVLFQAFTDGRLDVASYLADQGVTLDFSHNPALAASASEAFIASLLASRTPAPTATPATVQQQQQGEKEGKAAGVSGQAQQWQQDDEQGQQCRLLHHTASAGSAGAGLGTQLPSHPAGHTGAATQGSAAAGQQDQLPANGAHGAAGAQPAGASAAAAGASAVAAGASAVAAGARLPPAAAVLSRSEAVQQQALPSLALDNSQEAWARRLAFGVDANYARHDGMTPLLAAVVAGSAGAVRALLAVGGLPDPDLALAAAASAGASPEPPGAQGAAAAAAAVAPEAAEGSGEGVSVAPEAAGSQQAQQGQQKKKKKGHKAGTGSAQGGAEQQVHPPAPAMPPQPSPLVLACWRGKVEIAKLLMHAGADLNRASVPDIAPERILALVGPGKAGTSAPAPAAQLIAEGSQSAAAGSSAPLAGPMGQEPPSSAILSSSLSRAGGAVAAAGRAGMTPLMAAICSRDIRLVEALLNAGADPRCLPDKQNHTWSALALAVDLGLDDVVRGLVEAGACRGSTGRWISSRHPAPAALAWAAARERVGMVELLYPKVLEAMQGGDRCVVGQLSRHEARHPLAAAAEHGQELVVKCLLGLGASPNHSGSRKRGCGGYTPLMLAGEGGHLAIVEQLLAAGASPGATNEREECAASLALQGGHLAVARCCLGASKHAGEREAQLAVMAKKWHAGFAPGLPPAPSKQAPLALEQVERERAAYSNLVQALLDHKDGIARGVPPSVVARASAGSVALLDALLASGASPSRHQLEGTGEGSSSAVGQGVSCSSQGGDAAVPTGPLLDWAGFESERGSLPLLHACWFGWEAVARLLERGADVNEKSQEGTSLLLLAAGRAGLTGVGERLLAVPGLDLRQVDSSGRDAVGLAVKHKNAKFGELLLRRMLGGEASVGLAEQAPPGAFDTLLTHKVKSLSRINSPHPDSGETLLLHQVRTATPKAFKQLLLVPSLDVNVANPCTGCTPLMAAVGRRRLGMVEALLETGRVNIDAADAGGATALLHAARRHDAAVLRLLVATGADPHLADRQGDTPLMALARGAQHKPILELGRAHSLALDAVDSDGMTALMHAAAAGSFNAVKVLRNLGAGVLQRDGAGRSAYDLALERGHAELAVLLRPREQRGPGVGDGSMGGEDAGADGGQ